VHGSRKHQSAGKRVYNGAKLEERNLEDLKPFPLQAEFFDDIAGQAFDDLAEDIKRHGMEVPPEILPANSAGYAEDTILRGHQRCRALAHNGETTVIVLVRYDLANSDAETIENEFLRDNANRRQLDQLSRARVAKRLFELQKVRARGKLLSFEVEKARAHVGRIVGLSGKTLQRLWAVLSTPKEVQDAFRAKKLRIVDAARVATLEPKTQKEIARRIREGEEPKGVVGAYLPTSDGRHKNPDDAFASLVKSLGKNLNDLRGREELVSRFELRNEKKTLKDGRKLLETLLERASEPMPERASVDDVAADLAEAAKILRRR
jgi:hypothetical protein